MPRAWGHRGPPPAAVGILAFGHLHPTRQQRPATSPHASPHPSRTPPPQGCFSDWGICVYGILPCGLALDNAEAMGMTAEDDNQGCGTCMAMGCWFGGLLFAVPGVLMGAWLASTTRERMRTTYGLKGNACLDKLPYIL